MMRFTLLLLLWAPMLCAQDSVLTVQLEEGMTEDIAELPDFNWRDTTYKSIQLRGPGPGRVVKYDFGKKAVIVLGWEAVYAQGKKGAAGHWMKEHYAELIRQMDSAGAPDDTLVIREYHPGLNIVTNQLIKKGQAAVFDKTRGEWLNQVTHRLERYASQAYRFYFLADRSPFFGYMEISGILDVGPGSGEDHQLPRAAYGSLYDRLREIGN